MLDLNLQQIVRILAGRYQVVALILVLTVAGTYGVTMLLPSQYSATTTVVVDTKSPDPIASALATTTGTAQNYTLGITTEAEIVASDRVARQVVKTLKLDENPDVRELWRKETSGGSALDVWLGELMLKKLTVKTTTASNVISIKFVGADPQFAALVANAFARAYIDVSLALKTEPAKHNAEWFGQQEAALRENLQKAQAAMSKFQQEKNIIATVEQQDSETAILNDIEKQLTTALGASADFLSKKNAGDAAIALPEVANHSLLTSLKGELSRQEAKLQEAAGNLGKNHPQFQRMESEVAAVREKLQTETQNIISGFAASHAASDRKVAELRVAFEQQKKRVLRIKTDRDQLGVLQGEVEAAKKALDAVAGRFQQADLIRQATQVQLAVLTPAVAPLEPSAPKILLYTLLSIPAGFILGVVAALALEQVDQRVRSADDLAQMLQVPVLGAVARSRAPRGLRGPIGRLFPWRRPPSMAMK